MSAAKTGPILLVVAASIVLCIILFPSTGRDDVHITYWAAHSLAEHGEILNYSGLRLEQSTSLLHTIILATLTTITGISLPNLGLLFSAFCGIFTIFMTLKLFRAHFMSKGGDVELCLLLTTSTFFLYWSAGALEATLAALTTVLFFQYSFDVLFLNQQAKTMLKVTVATAAFFLTRPENVVIVLCFLVSLFALYFVIVRSMQNKASGMRLEGLLALLGVVIAVSCVIFGFRYAYFGEIFPHTVYAKSGALSLLAIKTGIKYTLRQAFSPYLLLDVILCLIGAIQITASFLASERSLDSLKKHILVVVFLSVYVAFVVTSGGDWMEGGRFFVPILPLLFIVIWNFIEKQRFKKTILAALVIYHLLATFVFVVNESTARPIWMLAQLKNVDLQSNHVFAERANAVHLRDIPLTNHVETLVREVGTQKAEKVVILSDYAGMVIYHLSLSHFPDLIFIDRCGLTTDHVKACKNYDSFRRGNRGVGAGYDDWLGGGCDIPQVDIVMTYSGSEEQVTAHGYTVVHRQTGVIMSYDWFLFKRIYSPRLYIAVRNEYVDHLKSMGLFDTEWRWNL